MVNKRYCVLGGLGELVMSIDFFIEKKYKAERLTQLAFVLYIVY